MMNHVVYIMYGTIGMIYLVFDDVIYVFDDYDNDGACVDLEIYYLLEPEAGIWDPVLYFWDDVSCI